jgi:hypothetical protein
MGVPTPNLRLGRKLKTVFIAAVWFSKLGSVAGGAERIIKDPTAEISDSNEGGEKSKDVDIMNGRDECSICEKYVKPFSYTCPCQICSCILHLSCAETKDWHCPTCHKDPLQNVSNQLSKDKSRSKRTFGERVEHDLITDDDHTGMAPISISC